MVVTAIGVLTGTDWVIGPEAMFKPTRSNQVVAIAGPTPFPFWEDWVCGNKVWRVTACGTYRPEPEKDTVPEPVNPIEDTRLDRMEI